MHVRPVKKLCTPYELKEMLPLSYLSEEVVEQGRKEIMAILSGKDSRFLVIVGPCSIHDSLSAYEYAERLTQLRTKYAEKLCIIMRVYFEKPRTVVGWKGLINDPHLNGTYDINEGRKRAREVLRTITEMGLPTATEFLDTRTPQCIGDLVSWAAIGARTVESQIHREMASSLPMPVGFKNGTGGSIQVAVDAVRSAREVHQYTSIDERTGEEYVVESQGNPFGHVVLRGGTSGPNFAHTSVAHTIQLLEQANLDQKIIIDCSHANAERDYVRQGAVMQDIIAQRNNGAKAIVGAMVESNLCGGKQNVDAVPLQYGVSVTDACVGWEDTEILLAEVFSTLK
jgi:3-deoxy-7-phosphoheptulonate synthase